MALHAVIGSQALKSFTKTLTCLSRCGDDVVIQAGPDMLILSATNSSKSAYFHVKLMPAYFDKYTLKPLTPPGMTWQTPPDTYVTGQLLVKSLLSILKHKTVDKSVDRCDLSIVEGGRSADRDTNDEPDEDSLSSKLVLRLHCKHGVVKTHRLLLFALSNMLAPKIAEIESASRLIVGPSILRDILDHFPHSRGDPHIAWHFAANDVVLRNIETRARDRGIATEISLSADEFDEYTIAEAPVSISFHLREFNATITLAESLSVALQMRFTLPEEPLLITFDTEAADAEYLFMISTTQNEVSRKVNPLKRGRADDNGDVGMTMKKSLRKADSAAPAPVSQAHASHAVPHSHPSQGSPTAAPDPDRASQHSDPQPLFLPGASQEAAFPPPASQLSSADLALVRSAGLGIEHMDYEEFEAMMEAEGEEVGMSTAVHGIPVGAKLVENHSDDVAMDLSRDTVHSETHSMDEASDMPMGASQAPAGRYGDREFRPLFDD